MLKKGLSFALSARLSILKYFRGWSWSIHTQGTENLPSKGGSILLCHHTSFLDPIYITQALPKKAVHFLIPKRFWEQKALQPFFKNLNASPLDWENPEAATKKAKWVLKQGGTLCLFPEEEPSQTGNILPLDPRYLKLANNLNAPTFPATIDNVWNNGVHEENGELVLKSADGATHPIGVAIGDQLEILAPEAVHAAIAELGEDAVLARRKKYDVLPLHFIRAAKKGSTPYSIEDTLGQSLPAKRVLIASLLLSKNWIQTLPEEQTIGVFLPTSCASTLINISLAIAGKTTVNLNFTAGPDAIQSAIEQAGIQTVITSRKFLEKMELSISAKNVLYAEDIFARLKGNKKAAIKTAILSKLLPAKKLWSLYGDTTTTSESCATIIFSSGTTGDPKGVMLSHHNILANIESVVQIFFREKPMPFLGVLPFFHSFGYTVTLWLPPLTGNPIVYHPNPADAKTIGQLIDKHKIQFMVSTPTFYQVYTRTCSAEQFRTLKLAIVGAEKLRPQVYNSFLEKFGIQLLEGYGCTELGPVVAVNRGDIDTPLLKQTGHKIGTIGQAIPGVATKLVHPETHAPLKENEDSGLLLIKSPARMMQYLGRNPNDSLIDGEWYITGDIASIDSDGFIQIVDRQARFSKIGGEMVPHLQIEEEINRILGETASIVVSIPDERKGETIAALYVHENITEEHIVESLNKTKLPKLWIPKKENLHRVEELPILGSGKPSLKEARTIAQRKQ